MKYNRNFVKPLIIIWIIAGGMFCQDLTIDLNVLNTSQFSKSAFDNSVDLWSVSITNTTDQEKKFKIKFQLKDMVLNQIAVDGRTKEMRISQSTTDIYSNSDSELDKSNLEYWSGGTNADNFISNYLSDGYLKPGTYRLIVSATESESPYNVIDEDESDYIQIILGDGAFEITYPDDGGETFHTNSINEFYIWWITPGFSNGIELEFRVIIAAILDDEGEEDAIDKGYNSVYNYDSNWEELPNFFNNWPWEETGAPINYILNYNQISDRGGEVVCGYKYAWRVDGREIIDGNQGLWHSESSIGHFTYGDILGESEDNPALNLIDGITVLPTFSWGSVYCAEQQNGYEIEIKRSEDDFDESGNILINSPTSIYPYNYLDPGFIPGQTYDWRVRIKPFANSPLPWSSKVSTGIGQFTITSLSNPEPEPFINTVLPEFNIEGPEDVISYQVIITSDNNYNNIVYDGANLGKMISFLPWTFEPEDPYNGLFPNTPYYYEIILLDGDNNKLDTDLIDQNDFRGSFIIDKVNLESPIDNSTNLPINQLFSWSAPDFVPGYIFELTDDQDPAFNDPQISVTLTGNNTHYQYPIDGEYPLDYERTYYWRVLPLDFDGNIGDVSSYSGCEFSDLEYSDCHAWKFKTSEFAEPIRPEPAQLLETVIPTFEINTPIGISYLTLKISDETDENIQNPKIYNEYEKIYPNSSNTAIWKYPNQDIEYGFHPGMKYYWKYLMYSDSDQLYGKSDDYNIMSFSIKDIELQFPEQGEENIPLNPKFIWGGPTDVPEYEFWISNEDDPELTNPKFIIDGRIENTFEYPEDGDFPLEYANKYYWRVVSRDINGNLGLSSSYSGIFQFTTSDFPELGESVEASSTNPRIPIINIIIMEGIEYTISIYIDSDGSTYLDEITGITNFPYEYTDGADKFEFGKTYYIQVQPTKDDSNFGPSSIMMPFSIPEEEIAQQCEISCTVTDNIQPEILTTILEGIEGATEYLLIVSANEDMSNPIERITFSNESQYLVSSDRLDWGQTYYTQVTAISNDQEIVGLPSEIQSISIESKPGMDEKTAISVTLPEGSIIPSLEIINSITGADGYRINISTESDMSTEFWQFDIQNTTFDYPRDGPRLKYGQSYYVTAHALDVDILHGIISNAVGFFIPNITPPILGDAFSWEPSIPAADQYLLEASLVEDFSVVIINPIIQSITYSVNLDELDYNTGYYWKVQGLNSEGENFGNSSQIKFFTTEPVPAPVLNVHSGEVSLTPEFIWSELEMAASYQIRVSSDIAMETILWQDNISNTSSMYPESAIQLDFATTYYWQILVLDEDDITLSISSIEPFSTKSIYPVSGLNPDGGAETTAPILQWEANERASSYKVIIASDAEMTNIELEKLSDGGSLKIGEGELKGVNYYWMVDGLDENGASLAGPSVVATLALPSKESISLLSPIGGEQITNLNPTLKWTALTGAEYYSLRISTDEGMGSIVYESKPTSTELIIPQENRLQNETKYFWLIEAGDPIITSDIAQFSTPASAAIKILGLEDGASISIKQPVFSWEAAEGISAFAIRVSENSDFSESNKFQIGATTFEYPGEPALNFKTTYYWQVIPLDKEGNAIGDWTTPRSFIISPAFIVELEMPGNGETASTSNPDFTWAAIEGVPKYEIQVSNNEEFSEILWSSSEIVENQTSYPKSGAEQLSYDQTYYWHVRAFGDKKPLGDFSSIFSFDISGDSKVSLEGPLNAESESLLPYFSWIPVKSVSVYTLTMASDESMQTIVYSNDANEAFLPYPSAAPPLSNGTKYYWNVIAKDENGNPIGDISDVGSFNTPSGIIKIQFIFGAD